MNKNSFQNKIASHIGKMLRDTFGKGPQSIYVSIDHTFIVIYLRNFLTPTEKLLFSQGQIRTVQHTRDIVMASLIPEIKAYLTLLTGINTVEFYYDWELHNRSGVLVARQAEEWAEELATPMTYEGKEPLHQEIGWISDQIQKRPDEIDSFMINDRTLLITRSGVLIDLSKELMGLQLEEPLKQAINHLEKKYLRNNTSIEQIFNTTIVDVFVDWDFAADTSIIVLILMPAS
ncbi:Na-translocating system protein MpsC family protein [Paenibacillus sanguinis]|uniref:Na-translocating system protein MpsC family protein n=1 Tax=Paenibacillus sanguinis TaxID=225906 RepID=UPI0003810F05|nr:Na-translocating system protein MpsC family protein [Paenibacillus sanguinis]